MDGWVIDDRFFEGLVGWFWRLKAGLVACGGCLWWELVVVACGGGL